jgi:hypothetical protein
MYWNLANRAGYYLLAIGLLSFVLPMFGFQFKLISFLGGAGVSSLLVFSFGIAIVFFTHGRVKSADVSVAIRQSPEPKRKDPAKTPVGYGRQILGKIRHHLPVSAETMTATATATATDNKKSG